MHALTLDAHHDGQADRQARSGKGTDAHHFAGLSAGAIDTEGGAPAWARVGEGRSSAIRRLLAVFVRIRERPGRGPIRGASPPSASAAAAMVNRAKL
jgi:hypothetical protein